jgi:O-antigen/teichoic acid export membrane protein
MLNDKVKNPKYMTPSRFGRLSSEAMWILVGQTASILGSLALIRLLTEHLNSALYGEWALCLTLVAVVNQVVLGGIAAGIARYFSIAVEADDLQGFLNDARMVIGRATAIVFLVASIGFIGLAIWNKTDWLLNGAVVLVFALLNGFSSCLNAIQAAARAHKSVAISTGASPWLTGVLIIVLMRQYQSSVLVVTVAYAMGAFLILFHQLIFFKKNLPKERQATVHMSPSNWSGLILNFSLPISLFGVFTWLQQASDRWALEHLSSTEAVGQYAVLFQLGFTPGALLIGLVTQFLGPILYQLSGTTNDMKRNQQVHTLALRAVGLSLFVTFVLFSGALFFHLSLFKLVTANQYWVVSSYLPWMVLAGGLFSAGQLLALKFMSEIKVRTITNIKITTSSAGIIINILGAYIWGLPGVVAALVLFSAFYFSWMFITTKSSKLF